MCRRDNYMGMPPRSAGRRKARSLASDEPIEAPSTQFVKDAAPLGVRRIHYDARGIALGAFLFSDRTRKDIEPLPGWRKGFRQMDDFQ